MTAPRRDRTGGIGPFAVGTLVLAVVVLALTGLTRACSVSAPGAIDRGSVQRVDVASVGSDAARVLPFAVRAPEMPADWIPQSSDTRAVPGGRAFRLGWVTPDDGFARLVQSDGSAEGLVASEEGAPAAGPPVSAGGLTWATYRGVRGELLWVTDVGGVRWLVTGNATPARFVQLASTALQSPVVPRT